MKKELLVAPSQRGKLDWADGKMTFRAAVVRGYFFVCFFIEEEVVECHCPGNKGQFE